MTEAEFDRWFNRLFANRISRMVFIGTCIAVSIGATCMVINAIVTGADEAYDFGEVPTREKGDRVIKLGVAPSEWDLHYVLYPLMAGAALMAINVANKVTLYLRGFREPKHHAVVETGYAHLGRGPDYE